MNHITKPPFLIIQGLALAAKMVAGEVFLDNLHSPSCPSPDNQVQPGESEFNWFSCGLDPESWYGINNNQNFDFYEAEAHCQAYGGELISITDENTDFCAYYAITRDPLRDPETPEFYLYSGKYFSFFDQWAWCPTYYPGSNYEDHCFNGFDQYENWLNDGNTADCMGGTLLSQGASFYEYGWTKKSCESVNRDKTRVMCKVSCDSQIDENIIFEYDGSMRSTYYGDPVTGGMGVIPNLPAQFEVEIKAVWDSTGKSYGIPLTIGHYYVCENGNRNTDKAYGPRIVWRDDGELAIYFHSRNDYSWYYFSPSININDGDQLSVQLKIYEDRFYINYTVNGNVIYLNTLNYFDRSVYYADSCAGNGNYRQQEQYEVPASLIADPILNMDDQGCSVSGKEELSTLTTQVQIRTLGEN